MERSQEQSELHDFVIEETVRNYYKESSEYEIFTNKNGEKKKDVKGFYPDIVIIDKSGQILVIEEIETKDSVNVDEKNRQWEVFSELGAKKFILTVPKEKVHEAASLTNGILCEIWFYEVKNRKLISRKFR